MVLSREGAFSTISAGGLHSDLKSRISFQNCWKFVWVFIWKIDNHISDMYPKSQKNHLKWLEITKASAVNRCLKIQGYPNSRNNHKQISTLRCLINGQVLINGKGGLIFCLLHEKQGFLDIFLFITWKIAGRVDKLSKKNKRAINGHAHLLST